jgi:corrinoid protein of di/trimethylamine methyltransferase
MKELLEQMKEAVLEGEEENAVALAKQALADQLDLKIVMDEGFLKGIQEAGQLFASGEYFLPDLVCSADAMKSALGILDEELKRPASGFVSKGKVIMTTVQGDVHDIGKIIVGAMLTANGYEVFDLGVDVPNEEVLEAVDQIRPDILGLSALLTTTMVEQKNIIEMLKGSGKRNDVMVIVGGAPVTHEWANKIGADGYSDDAISAVALVNKLLLERG